MRFKVRIPLIRSSADCRRCLGAVNKKLTEVALDTRWSDALGDDTEAFLGDPSDQHLSRILLALIRNLGDLGRVDDPGFPGDVVAKRGVGGEMDSLVLAIS